MPTFSSNQEPFSTRLSPSKPHYGGVTPWPLGPQLAVSGTSIGLRGRCRSGSPCRQPVCGPWSLGHTDEARPRVSFRGRSLLDRLGDVGNTQSLWHRTLLHSVLGFALGVLMRPFEVYIDGQYGSRWGEISWETWFTCDFSTRYRFSNRRMRIRRRAHNGGGGESSGLAQGLGRDSPVLAVGRAVAGL